jgi:methylglutaconyl-CoA hydratase
MTDTLLVSEKNGMVILSLNRPEKRNALDGHLISQLLHAIQSASQRSTTRMLLIHGIGDHFCSGADINWMKHISLASQNNNLNDARILSRLMYQLHIFPRPTIVMAHGVTLGGGLGLLAACDIALAASDANFEFSEIKIGLIPAIISPYIISAIGERAARYYFLSGKRFNSEEAERIGLIHQILPHEDYQAAGLAFTHSLNAYSPLALHTAKQFVRQIAHSPITEELAELTADRLANLRVSPEAQEGLRAFLEKRSPKWS